MMPWWAWLLALYVGVGCWFANEQFLEARRGLIYEELWPVGRRGAAYLAGCAAVAVATWLPDFVIFAIRHRDHGRHSG